MAEYAATLRNLYSILGITANSVSDELDHMVLTSEVISNVSPDN